MSYRKPLTHFFWGVLLVATTIGLGAVAIRAHRGLSVTNLNYVVPWGLWVAFYIYFIGLSAGSFLLSTLIYVFGVERYERVGRVALFSALIALIAGLLFVLVDLGHMERFWTVFVNRNLWSVLEIEIHFYVLYIIILCAELWLLMRRDLIRCAGGEGWRATLCRLLTFGSRDLSEASAQRDMRIVRVLGIIGIPTAIGVHGGTGAIFAVVKARPMWFGPLFPIIFIISALVSGGALLTFLTAFFGRLPMEERRALTLDLGKLTAGILAFDLLLMWSEFSVGIYGGIPEHLEVMRLTFFGPFWWVFWLVQILFGALVPLALILWPVTGRDHRWVGLAGLMMVVGIFGVRLNIVIPALNAEILPGYLDAYHVIPAPTVAVPAYPLTTIIWLARLAILAALATFLLAGFLAWRRARGQAIGRVGQVATAVTAVLIVLLSLRWIGGTTSLNISAFTPVRGAVPSVLGGLFGETRLAFLYIPSPNEWLSSVGLLGLTVLLFILGWKALPLETEHQEVQQ